jgi:hypothetical protein
LAITPLIPDLSIKTGVTGSGDGRSTARAAYESHRRRGLSPTGAIIAFPVDKQNETL